jgi:hypothetical protein
MEGSGGNRDRGEVKAGRRRWGGMSESTPATAGMFDA